MRNASSLLKNRACLTAIQTRKLEKEERGVDMTYAHLKAVASAVSLWALVAVPLVVPMVSSAQTPKALELEEVIVTAQKREESLLDTPMTVNVISSRTFNDTASFQLADIDRLTAGVDIKGDTVDREIVVRGVGADLFANTSPRVTLYKDGALMNQQESGVFLAQYDLDRFELLRGPQGTLYGKSSPAGALVIHTRNPSLTQYDGYVQSSVFSRDGSNTQFGASVPVVEDRLGFRIAGLFDKNSNKDIHNATRDDDEVQRTSAGRAIMRWLATPRFDMRVSYDYIEHKSDSYNVVGGGNTGLEAEDRVALSDADSFLLIRDQHAIAQFNYQFTPGLMLSNVSSYQEIRRIRFVDSDDTAQPMQTQLVDTNHGKILKTELRLHNTTIEKWDWITGLYYEDNQARTPVEVVTNFPGGTNIFSLVADTGDESWALFHHSTIHLTLRDRLTVGIRYNDVATNARTRTLSRTFVGGTLVSRQEREAIPLEFEKREFEVWTGTVKFQHDFTDRMTGYLTWDRGWRNASATVDATGDMPDELTLHDDEFSNNFELGLKGKYWDGRGRYTSAVYLQQYEDFQFNARSILVDTDGDGMADATFTAVVNADEAISSGAEVETSVLLTPNWNGTVSLSYNDTEFEDFEDAPCNRGSSVPTNSFNRCDFSGQRISGSPNWSAVVHSEYSLPVPAWQVEWFVRGLAKYESFRLNISTGEKLDSETLVDAFTGFRGLDGRWDVSLWVKNVTDEVVIERKTSPLDPPVSFEVNNPRTVGITGAWRWGQK